MSTTPLVMESINSGRKWRVLAACGAAFILTVVSAYVVLAVYDGPVPDDRAMTTEWPSARSGTHPLSEFLEATRQSKVLELESEAKAHPLTGIEPPSPVFVALDNLLATDPRSWDWPDGSKQEKILQSDLEALDLLEAVKAMLMRRAHHVGKAGQAAAAVQDCLRLIRLGAGLAHTRTTGMRLTTAVKFQQYGIASMERFITASTISPGDIRQTLAELLHLDGPTLENCRFAIRVQYQNLKHLLQDQATQEAVLKELDRNPPWRDEIKVNQTLSTWLSSNAPVYDALTIDWHTTATALNSVTLATTNREPWNRQIATLRRNRAGRLYVVMMSPLSTVRHVVQFKIVHSQAILMLALRLYELENAQLPEQLSQLTPGILLTLPLDTPTAQPLHWNSDTHLLYSSGLNATDDGGSATLHRDILSSSRSKQAGTADDLGQRYWWSDEARERRAISGHQNSDFIKP